MEGVSSPPPVTTHIFLPVFVPTQNQFVRYVVGNEDRSSIAFPFIYSMEGLHSKAETAFKEDFKKILKLEPEKIFQPRKAEGYEVHIAEFTISSPEKLVNSWEAALKAFQDNEDGNIIVPSICGNPPAEKIIRGNVFRVNPGKHIFPSDDFLPELFNSKNDSKEPDLQNNDIRQLKNISSSCNLSQDLIRMLQIATKHKLLTASSVVGSGALVISSLGGWEETRSKLLNILSKSETRLRRLRGDLTEVVLQSQKELLRLEKKGTLQKGDIQIIRSRLRDLEEDITRSQMQIARIKDSENNINKELKNRQSDATFG